MHFVVKFFPEITIKTAPVRKRFIRQLRHNLSRQFNAANLDVTLTQSWDKMEVTATNHDPVATREVADILAHTPGIAYFAEVNAVEFSGLDDLANKVVPIWSSMLSGRSFCVRAKRKGSHAFNSHDVEIRLGGDLLRATDNARVKLEDPEVTVNLEIVEQLCYVFLSRRKGLGGFPLGTQDAVLSLMSGGFDSTVASYLTIKRGLLTHFCFFNLGGRAHELGVKEVSYFLWRKYSASHPVKFISVPFEEVVGEILEKIHHSQMGVVLKRMMLRVATRVADNLNIQALVTGESVAQVASQTLTNLSVIDSVTNTLVLRPLITMDKGDIIDLSRTIGTEEFAASMPEYCGVISVKPTTRASKTRVEQEEAKFNWDKLEAAYVNRHTVSITAVEKDLAGALAAPIETSPDQHAVIIDIRHPDEEEKKPLTGLPSTIKKIPFFRLNSQFPLLEAGPRYLLYCDRGVMSQLHAANLVEAGFKNVGVFRPATAVQGVDETSDAE